MSAPGDIGEDVLCAGTKLQNHGWSDGDLLDGVESAACLGANDSKDGVRHTGDDLIRWDALICLSQEFLKGWVIARQHIPLPATQVHSPLSMTRPSQVLCSLLSLLSLLSALSLLSTLCSLISALCSLCSLLFALCSLCSVLSAF
jgi:hypothetical protein